MRSRAHPLLRGWKHQILIFQPLQLQVLAWDRGSANQKHPPTPPRALNWELGTSSSRENLTGNSEAAVLGGTSNLQCYWGEQASCRGQCSAGTLRAPDQPCMRCRTPLLSAQPLRLTSSSPGQLVLWATGFFLFVMDI